MIDKCKGVFWRAHVSSYVSSHNSLEVRKSLRLLKRKSCPGCADCDFIYEYLSEDIAVEPSIDYIGDLEHGKIYTITFHTSKVCYELYPEIDEVSFIEAGE